MFTGATCVTDIHKFQEHILSSLYEIHFVTLER